jgi:3-oxoacyl-[acyl-carrier-protein] synthase-3
MGSIIKTAYHLPSRVITNADLEEIFPGSNIEGTAKKIGVYSRRIAEIDETASDLGFQAAEKVLVDYDRSKIDFLIFCTQSPDYFLPTSACILQDRLKLGEIPAFDFNLGCSGYIYGLAMAESFINSGMASNVLLITGETYSKHIFENDKANKIIFGDGASATIIEKGEGIGKFNLGSDGSGFDKLIVQNGGFRNPVNNKAVVKTYGNGNEYDENHIHMDGPEVFNFTIKVVPDTIEKTLANNKMNIEEVDLFIFHQANKFMLSYLRKKLGIPEDKFYLSLADTGNTVSATIPIAIVNATNDGEIKKGKKVMLVGFGVGLSWGSTIIKF